MKRRRLNMEQKKTDFKDKNVKPPESELPEKAVDWIWSLRMKTWIAVLPKENESKEQAIKRVTEDHQPGRRYEDL